VLQIDEVDSIRAPGCDEIGQEPIRVEMGLRHEPDVPVGLGSGLATRARAEQHEQDERFRAKAV
jgi:hypothetical protein